MPCGPLLPRLRDRHEEDIRASCISLRLYRLLAPEDVAQEAPVAWQGGARTMRASRLQVRGLRSARWYGASMTWLLIVLAIVVVLLVVALVYVLRQIGPPIR
jgi:hypothetical protein